MRWVNQISCTLVNMQRDELLQKLRDNIKGKRAAAAAPLTQQLRADPQGAMLAMGVDDTTILANAKSIVNNPNAFIKAVRLPRRASSSKSKAVLDDNVESDDESPPPPLQ